MSHNIIPGLSNPGSTTCSQSERLMGQNACGICGCEFIDNETKSPPHYQRPAFPLVNHSMGLDDVVIQRYKTTHNGPCGASDCGIVVRTPCGHLFCKCCLVQYFRDAIAQGKVYNLPCPLSVYKQPSTSLQSLKHNLSSPPDAIIRAPETCFYPIVSVAEYILSQGLLRQLNNAAENQLISMTDIKCPQCSIYLDSPDPITGAERVDKTNAHGEPLSLEHYLHYKMYCVECKECTTTLCTNCSVSPYHLGRRCDEEPPPEPKKCIYCDTMVIKGKNDYATLVLKTAALYSNLIADANAAKQLRSMRASDEMHRFPKVPAIFQTQHPIPHPLPEAYDYICDGGLLKLYEELQIRREVALRQIEEQKFNPTPGQRRLHRIDVPEPYCTSYEDLPDCLKYADTRCNRRLPCNCFCNGVRGEALEDCPPCFNHEAKESYNDTCVICQCALRDGPIFVSGTYQHLYKRIQKKNDGTTYQLVTPADTVFDLQPYFEHIGLNGQCLNYSSHPSALARYKSQSEDTSSSVALWNLEDELPPLLPYTEPRKVCKHTFHYHCFLSQLSNAWNNDRITFRYLKCPGCSLYVYHPLLTPYLIKHYALEQYITARSIQRLEYEGFLSIEVLDDKKDAIGEDQSAAAVPLLTHSVEGEAKPKTITEHVDKALENYVFYECFKCKKPYFAGAIVCQASHGDDMHSGGAVRPEDLICLACNPSAGKSCEIHGDEMLIYKCKYCCKPSAFECWGNTYFCADCHKSGVWQTLSTQKTGENRKAIIDYPQCPSIARQIRELMDNDPTFTSSSITQYDRLKEIRSDPTTCQLGIEHAPNGFNFVIGCALCKADYENELATGSCSDSQSDCHHTIDPQKFYGHHHMVDRHLLGTQSSSRDQKNRNATSLGPSAKNSLFDVPRFELDENPYTMLSLFSYMALLRILFDKSYILPQATAYNKLTKQRYTDIFSLALVIRERDSPQADKVSAAQTALRIIAHYRYDQDTNGLIYFLGTLGHTQPFINPHIRGLVECTSSDLASDSLPAYGMLEREDSRCVTHPSNDRYFTVDLKLCQVLPTAYTLKHYNSHHTECIRNWTLEACVAPSSGYTQVDETRSEKSEQLELQPYTEQWVTLMKHENDTAISGKNSSHTWGIPSTANPTRQWFSKFRIRATGPNCNNSKFLALVGFEIYGAIELPSVHALYLSAKNNFTIQQCKNQLSDFFKKPVVTSIESGRHVIDKMWLETMERTGNALPRNRQLAYYKSVLYQVPACFISSASTLLPNVLRFFFDRGKRFLMNNDDSEPSILDETDQCEVLDPSAINFSVHPKTHSIIEARPTGINPSQKMSKDRLAKASPESPVIVYVSSPRPPESLFDLVAGQHGIFRFLGLLNNTRRDKTYSNPFRLGFVGLFCSSPFTTRQHLESLVDESDNGCVQIDPYPGSKYGAWVCIDLGAYRASLIAYSLGFTDAVADQANPNASITSTPPTDWVIEGSLGYHPDDLEWRWDTLLHHRNEEHTFAIPHRQHGHSNRVVFPFLSKFEPDTRHRYAQELNLPNHVERDEPHPAMRTSKLYRYFRIRSLSTDKPLFLNHIELYGDLCVTTTPPPPVNPRRLSLINRWFAGGILTHPLPSVSGGISDGIGGSVTPAFTDVIAAPVLDPLSGNTSQKVTIPQLLKDYRAIPGLCVRTFNYRDDFDGNGLLYYMGSHGLTDVHRNPTGDVISIWKRFQQQYCIAEKAYIELYGTAKRHQSLSNIIYTNTAVLISSPVPTTSVDRFSTCIYSSSIDYQNQSCPASVLTGIEPKRPWRTQNQSQMDQYFIIDIGQYSRLYPTAYTLRFTPLVDGVYDYPVNWQLFGSIDGQKQWDLLAVHEDDSSLNNKSMTQTWTLGPSPLSTEHDFSTPFGVRVELPAYRFFCVLQTGVNGAGRHNLSASNIEFYGLLISSSLPLSHQPFPARCIPPKEVKKASSQLLARQKPKPAVNKPSAENTQNPFPYNQQTQELQDSGYRRIVHLDGVNKDNQQAHYCTSILEFLGTWCKQEPFENPCATGLCRVSSSPLLHIPSLQDQSQSNGDQPQPVVMRDENDIRTALQSLLNVGDAVDEPSSGVLTTYDGNGTVDHQGQNYIVFDMRVLIQPFAYSLRHPQSLADRQHLRNWDLQASDDGQRWYTISSHVNDYTIQQSNHWYQWSISPYAHKNWFRYFRIKLTGLNSNGQQYLALGGFDLKGYILRSP